MPNVNSVALTRKAWLSRAKILKKSLMVGEVVKLKVKQKKEVASEAVKSSYRQRLGLQKAEKFRQRIP